MFTLLLLFFSMTHFFVDTELRLLSIKITCCCELDTDGYLIEDFFDKFNRKMFQLKNPKKSDYKKCM